MDFTGINFVDVEYYYAYRYGSSLLVSTVDDILLQSRLLTYFCSTVSSPLYGMYLAA